MSEFGKYSHNILCVFSSVTQQAGVHEHPCTRNKLFMKLLLNLCVHWGMEIFMYLSNKLVPCHLLQGEQMTFAYQA